jgi:hypothetical protein
MQNFALKIGLLVKRFNSRRPTQLNSIILDIKSCVKAMIKSTI